MKIRVLLFALAAVAARAQGLWAVDTRPGLQVVLAEAPFNAPEKTVVVLQHGLMPPEALAAADAALAGIVQAHHPEVSLTEGGITDLAFVRAAGGWTPQVPITLLSCLVRQGLVAPPGPQGPGRIYFTAWLLALKDRAGYLRDLETSMGRNAWVLGPWQILYRQILSTHDYPELTAFVRGNEAQAQPRPQPRLVVDESPEAQEQRARMDEEMRSRGIERDPDNPGKWRTIR